jgi:hypothetical protein
MATPTRIYLVTDAADGGCYLIRAISPAQAIKRVTTGRYEAVVASQDDLLEMINLGAKVIDATQVEAPPVDSNDGQASLLEDSVDNDVVAAEPVAEAA